jgi:protocatechuate 3,4-dioxygenase alpha subunit
VLDGAGEPVPDAMVEIWQADASGRYHGDFGWGRCGTDADGRFRFRTVVPGPVPAADGTPRAPHVWVLVFARGLLKPVLTRMSFPGAGADPLLAALEPDERDRLVAAPDGEGRYRFDVHLQGDHQTPFFVV